MFYGADGKLSTTKITSFFGFFLYIAVSVYVLTVIPEKFDFAMFSIVCGGGSVSTKILDKYLNVVANGGKE